MATHRAGAVDPAVAARQNRRANRRLRAYEYRSPSTRNRTHSWVMINAETWPCKSVAPSGKRTVHPQPIVLQIPSLESRRALWGFPFGSSFSHSRKHPRDVVGSARLAVGTSRPDYAPLYTREA